MGIFNIFGSNKVRFAHKNKHFNLKKKQRKLNDFAAHLLNEEKRKKKNIAVDEV